MNGRSRLDRYRTSNDNGSDTSLNKTGSYSFAYENKNNSVEKTEGLTMPETNTVRSSTSDEIDRILKQQEEFLRKIDEEWKHFAQTHSMYIIEDDKPEETQQPVNTASEQVETVVEETTEKVEDVKPETPVVETVTEPEVVETPVEEEKEVVSQPVEQPVEKPEEKVKEEVVKEVKKPEKPIESLVFGPIGKPVKEEKEELFFVVPNFDNDIVPFEEESTPENEGFDPFALADDANADEEDEEKTPVSEVTETVSEPLTQHEEVSETIEQSVTEPETVETVEDDKQTEEQSVTEPELTIDELISQVTDAPEVKEEKKYVDVIEPFQFSNELTDEIDDMEDLFGDNGFNYIDDIIDQVKNRNIESGNRNNFDTSANVFEIIEKKEVPTSSDDNEEPSIDDISSVLQDNDYTKFDGDYNDGVSVADTPEYHPTMEVSTEPEKPETMAKVLELTKELETERLLREEMLEQTKHLSLQISEYENEMKDLQKTTDKTNKALNFLLTFLVLALLTVLGVIGYWIGKERGLF